VIIGGVAAGATAAARARRLDESAEIILLERGPYISFANCGLPYFIGRAIQRRSHLLLQTPEGFFCRYRIDVRVNAEAMEIRRDEKVVVVRKSSGVERVAYDKLILAQGGSPVMPPLPGIALEHVFKLWTIPDMDRIHKFLDDRKPAHAVVVGGGLIGLEMVEAFRQRGMQVTLVELAPRVMITMDPEFGAMIGSDLEHAGVNVRTGVGVAEIRGSSVVLTDGTSLESDLVLLSVGVRPELTLARNAGLEIGEGGGLQVDETLRTSDPDIFAAGDMVEVMHRVSGRKVRVPLAGPANRQGRIAATNALGGNMRYRGALGTTVVKIFEHTAAATGLSEQAARAAGLDTGVAYVFKDDHVKYYPGGKPLALKIVFDQATGRLLGGQAYGQQGVEKRIDVLAVALHGGMSVEDLSELDLAYAPPYNSANDPVNLAAFVASNHLSGYSTLKTPAEALHEVVDGRGVILDVRTVGEQSRAPLSGVLHIPADEVRDRLDEIPKGSALYILSKDGFLGHTTLQILKANGQENIFNITGGYSAARWFDDWKFVS
jgi:NADPH-dependent 2,4-dienoyl-CoA reductase/sulfur reductase-like enzyme/rhodanese-related sulfurtransferase